MMPYLSFVVLINAQVMIELLEGQMVNLAIYCIYIIKALYQVQKGVESANEQVELHFQRFNMKLSIKKKRMADYSDGRGNAYIITDGQIMKQVESFEYLESNMISCLVQRRDMDIAYGC